MKKIRKVWSIHFLRCELSLAIFITIIFFIWYAFLSGQTSVEYLLEGRQDNIFGTLATISGSLLGFTITATSIVIGFSSSPRLKILKNSPHYHTLWQIFISTIRVLGLSTITFLIALIFSPTIPPNIFVLSLSILFLFLSIFRVMRTIWALEATIRIVAKSDPSS